MAAYVLTKEAFLKGMATLKEHGPLFKGLRPDQIYRVAKSNGLLGRMPKTKEGIALLCYAWKNMKDHPRLQAMVKEIRCDNDGKIKLVMGNVDQHDVTKAAAQVWHTPKSGLYDINQQLKQIY